MYICEVELAWSILHIPGQLGLPRETLSQRVLFSKKGALLPATGTASSSSAGFLPMGSAEGSGLSLTFLQD